MRTRHLTEAAVGQPRLGLEAPPKCGSANAGLVDWNARGLSLLTNLGFLV